MIALGLIITAYLLGAIPWGYLIYRQKTGRDIRAEDKGSGNIGATNVARLAGKSAGIVTLILDIGKGVLAVMLVRWIVPASANPEAIGNLKSICAVAVLSGHMFPIFLGFRGGKGVAAALGAFAALAPWAVLAAIVVFAVIVAVTRYVSLASMIAAVLYLPAFWIFYHPPAVQMAAAAFCVALIIYKHSANIERLMNAAEAKI